MRKIKLTTGSPVLIHQTHREPGEVMVVGEDVSETVADRFIRTHRAEEWLEDLEEHGLAVADDPVADAARTLLDATAKQVKDDLSDALLNVLEAALEQERADEKPRKSVIEAIEAEIKSRRA